MSVRLVDAPTEEWIHRLCERWHIPGMSVTVVRLGENGKTEHQSMFHGLRDAQRRAYDDHSLFCIASCSKLFTAYALGILINVGSILRNGSRLAWTTKVKDVLPEWKLADEFATKDIDLTDLLSFRTGLPGHDRALTSSSSSDQLALLAQLPLSCSIRQARQYSNLSSNIGALIVSRVSGQDFAQFVKGRILVPLGMEATTYVNDEVVRSGQQVEGFAQDTDVKAAQEALWRAKQSAGGSKNGEIEEMKVPGEAVSHPKAYRWEREQEIMKHHAGCGGIWTNADDWAKWLTELLHPSLLPASSPTRRVIFSSHSIPYTSPVLPETGFYTYGLGTYLLSWRGRLAYFHGGMVPGQYSVQYVLPPLASSRMRNGNEDRDGRKAGWAVAVHSNEDTWGAYVNQVVARGVMDVLLGKDGEEGGGRGWEKRVMDLGEPGSESDSDSDPDYESDAEEEEDQVCREPATREPADFPIEGRYAHPAYPEFHIAALDPSDPVVPYLGAISRRLASPVDFSDRRNTYIARLPALYVEEVLFVRSATSPASLLFTWIALKLYPAIDGDGDETGERVVPFIDGTGSCLFAREGLGMAGDWWVSGGKAEKETKPGMTKEDCEVWYDRKGG